MQTKQSLAEQGRSPEMGTARRLEEQPIGVLSVGVFEKEETAEEPAQSIAKPMKSQNWFSKLSNLFRGKKAAQAAQSPVQTEWSLDKVKVIRNDLSDVDLDIVFASVDASAAPKKASAKKEKLVGSAWRRVNPNPQKQEQMVLK